MSPRPPGEIQTIRPYNLPGLYDAGTYTANGQGSPGPSSAAGFVVGGAGGFGAGLPPGPPRAKAGLSRSSLRLRANRPARVGGMTGSPPRLTTSWTRALVSFSGGAA